MEAFSDRAELILYNFQTNFTPGCYRCGQARCRREVLQLLMPLTIGPFLRTRTITSLRRWGLPLARCAGQVRQPGRHRRVRGHPAVNAGFNLLTANVGFNVQIVPVSQEISTQPHHGRHRTPCRNHLVRTAPGGNEAPRTGPTADSEESACKAGRSGSPRFVLAARKHLRGLVSQK